MINRVVLVGRLTRDPELRTTNAGGSMCSFTVAVDDRTKDVDGNFTTSFINCVTFNQTADTTAKYARKGSLVGVEGRIRQRKFDRQDGSKGSVFEIVCDSVQFLEPKNKQASEANDVQFDDVAPVEQEPASSGNNLDSLNMADDDLPF